MKNRLIGALAPLLGACVAFFAAISASAVPVTFSNPMFGTERLVLGLDGLPLAGTNWQAQLYRDTGSGLILVPGVGTGRFPSPTSSGRGTWSGGVRELVGVAPNEVVQLEVRIWDATLYGTFEAAAVAGGITGTSGLFEYVYTESQPLAPSDSWMRNLPVIRLQPPMAGLPLIERITYPTPQEGVDLPVTPVVSGGAAPLRYLWQLPGGRQDTNRVLQLGGAGLRPGLIDFNLTVTDANGRSTPPARFQVEVANRSPEVRTVVVDGTNEGETVHVRATADYAWPSSAIRASWVLEDGRSFAGLETDLPRLTPGRHTVHLRIEELGLVSVYNNLLNPNENGLCHLSLKEIGDEVIFTQTNQIIHEVSFVYFADLAAMSAQERSRVGGRLRLYLNDGPTFQNLTSRLPGTMVYESPLFGVNAGMFLQRFSDIRIPAPDRLTWSVVWTNVPQTAGRSVGLVFGSTNTASNTGFSYDDFLSNDGSRWQFYRFGSGRPVANFSTRASIVGTNVIGDLVELPVEFEVTNRPPVLNSVGIPAELVAGRPGTFRALAYDAGEGALRYRWEFGDGQAGEGSEVSHAYATTGNFTGRLRATDAFGGEDVREFVVVVGADVRPLVFVGTPPIEAVQDRDYSGDVSVNPPGIGQSITLRPVTLPSWLQWTESSPTSGRLQGRPGNADVGAHDVVIESSDGSSTQSLSFRIVVADVNDPPALSAPASIVFKAREGSPEIPVALSDPDPADRLEFSVVSEDPTGLPNGRIVLGGSGTNRTFRILPVEGETRTVPLVLTVSDGELTARAAVQVTIEAMQSFTVGVATNRGGTVALNPVADRYEEGFRIQATASPFPGYELRQWTGLPGGPLLATNLDLLWTVTTNALIGGVFADIAPPSIQWDGLTSDLSETETVVISGTILDNDRVAAAQLLRPGEGAIPLVLTEGRFALEGVRLQVGSNPFTVVATDASGNASTNRMSLVWQPGSVLVVGDAPDTREGQIVSFPVRINNASAISGMSFNLRFEDYVDFLGEAAFEPSGLLPGALITVNTNQVGVVRVTIATAGQSLPPGRSLVGNLRLRVRSLLSPIGLQAFIDPELLEVSNEFGDPVPGVDGVSGQARLLPRRLTADLNGNNRLDIGDATLLQRLAVNLDPRRSWDTALNDLNRNGSIDSGDVVRLMRVVVGLDPQPVSRTAGSSWPVARAARRLKSQLGWLEMDPATVSLDRGQVVEVNVRVKSIPPRLRGLRFTLAYPPGSVGLVGTDGYEKGPALPPGSTPYWNNQPQEGRLQFGLSAETNWPVSSGVLARFRFYVSQSLPTQWRGELGLADAEFTYNGYEVEEETVDPTSANLGEDILVPYVSRFRMNEGGGIQLNLAARMGSTLVVESTQDIGLGAPGWQPVGTFLHTGQPFYMAPTNGGAGSATRFYRLRGEVPAVLPPVDPTPVGR